MIKWYFWSPFRKQEIELIINWVKIGQHTSEQIRWPEHPRRKRSPGRIIRGTSVPSDDRAQYPSAHWEFNMAFPFKMCFVPDKHCKSISCSSGRAQSCAGKSPNVLPCRALTTASKAQQQSGEVCATRLLVVLIKIHSKNWKGDNNTACFAF